MELIHRIKRTLSGRRGDLRSNTRCRLNQPVPGDGRTYLELFADEWGVREDQIVSVMEDCDKASELFWRIGPEDVKNDSQTLTELHATVKLRRMGRPVTD